MEFHSVAVESNTGPAHGPNFWRVGMVAYEMQNCLAGAQSLIGKPNGFGRPLAPSLHFHRPCNRFI